jgi:hypothetical protein
VRLTASLRATCEPSATVVRGFQRRTVVSLMPSSRAICATGVVLFWV